MFHRLAVPTPFQVGPVNCYLAGRTLIDPGPDSDDAWHALCAMLDDHGCDPDDIDQILITHPHPDHFGLAGRFADRGTAVMASPVTAEIIADFAGRLAYEQEYFEPFFVRHGLSADVASTVVELPAAYLEFAPSVETDRIVTDGERVDTDDGQIIVEAVAGHAPGETIFTFAEGDGESAIVGDHVLDPITPNPFLQPPPDTDGDRPRVLPAYNDSLDRLADRDFVRLLPGHRDEIDRPTHRIEQLRRFHEYRTDRVADLLDDPMSGAEVMRSLFGDLPVTEQFSGMSEAIGHLDVLEMRDRVERLDGEPIRYRRVADQ